jgi:hypothetical protein
LDFEIWICFNPMFTIDENITEAQLKGKDLFKAITSLNTHEVATPDMSLEEARSFVFFFREGNRMSVYIGLHLLRTDRRLFYTHSANPFLQDVLKDLEDEARNFAEGLGAFLDEPDFAKMSDVEKDRWIEEQSIFGPKKETAPAEQAQQAPEPLPSSAPAQAAPTPQSPPVPPASVQAAPASQPVAPPAPPAHAVPAPQPMTPPPAPEPPAPDEIAFEQESFEPPSHTEPAETPMSTAAKKRQEIMDMAIKAGIAKPPKQPLVRDIAAPSASMVSRDREALARLLTSF